MSTFTINKSLSQKRDICLSPKSHCKTGIFTGEKSESGKIRPLFKPRKGSYCNYGYLKSEVFKNKAKICHLAELLAEAKSKKLQKKKFNGKTTKLRLFRNNKKT